MLSLRSRCFLAYLSLISCLAFSQGTEISKDFRSEGDRKPSTFEALNRLVQNRGLASSLASGVVSLNRTVDSLMEALFYSIMDQSITFEASDNLALTSGYEREVHGTSIGAYVVVDKFRLGPDFLKDLGKIRGLPLTFSNQTHVFITNATLRSDAQRKSEGERHGYWRELLNNWLGLIPLLSSVLPPSFNPEELYDPAGYLATPFLFPRDVKEALDMPLGTVRAYGLSGITQFSVDLKGSALKKIQENLQLADLDLSVPFSLFHEGEHRISILRRNENEVWLSLSELRRLGHSVSVDLSKGYSAFRQLVKWWTGLPIPIAPIDFSFQKSHNIRLDELFAFDLREVKAQEAFGKALHGDFDPARELGETPGEQPNKSGVTFHFRRFSTKNEDGLRQSRSFYVAQSQKQSILGSGESRTIDRQGEFFTLDAEFVQLDRDWDVLVGPETAEFKHRLSIPVRKELRKGKDPRYELASNIENPLYMTATLKVADDFVDTRELQNILELFRLYSGLTFNDIPQIPIRALDLEKRLLSVQALANPMDEIKRRELTPTHLGRFAAYAHLYFSHDLMMALARQSREQMWGSFATSFQAEPTFWAEEGVTPGFTYYANWLGSYALSPLRLMNFESNYPDLVVEVRRVEAALQKLLSVTDPLEILDAYRQILDTNHPVQLIRSLVTMARGLPLPIIVGFNANPKSQREDTPDVKKAKEDFASLDNRIFSSDWPIPSLKRDQSVEEKLASFEIGNYTNSRVMPSLLRLSLHLDGFATDNNGRYYNQFVADFNIQNPPSANQPLYVYLRIEQNSPINIGRFVLGEELIELRPAGEIAANTASTPLADRGTYRLFLTGPTGLKDQSYLDDTILMGGALDLIVSLSDNGEEWGPEQKLSFRIENGLLIKL